MADPIGDLNWAGAKAAAHKLGMIAAAGGMTLAAFLALGVPPAAAFFAGVAIGGLAVILMVAFLNGTIGVPSDTSASSSSADTASRAVQRVRAICILLRDDVLPKSRRAVGPSSTLTTAEILITALIRQCDVMQDIYAGRVGLVGGGAELASLDVIVEAAFWNIVRDSEVMFGRAAASVPPDQLLRIDVAQANIAIRNIPGMTDPLANDIGELVADEMMALGTDDSKRANILGVLSLMAAVPRPLMITRIRQRFLGIPGGSCYNIK